MSLKNKSKDPKKFINISGCMDSEALNYNYKAGKDDGSCTYEEYDYLFFMEPNKKVSTHPGTGKCKCLSSYLGFDYWQREPFAEYLQIYDDDTDETTTIFDDIPERCVPVPIYDECNQGFIPKCSQLNDNECYCNCVYQDIRNMNNELLSRNTCDCRFDSECDDNKICVSKGDCLEQEIYSCGTGDELCLGECHFAQEGCMDPNALNYDENNTIHNQQACTYNSSFINNVCLTVTAGDVGGFYVNFFSLEGSVWYLENTENDAFYNGPTVNSNLVTPVPGYLAPNQTKQYALSLPPSTYFFRFNDDVNIIAEDSTASVSLILSATNACDLNNPLPSETIELIPQHGSSSDTPGVCNCAFWQETNDPCQEDYNWCNQFNNDADGCIAQNVICNWNEITPNNTVTYLSFEANFEILNADPGCADEYACNGNSGNLGCGGDPYDTSCCQYSGYIDESGYLSIENLDMNNFVCSCDVSAGGNTQITWYQYGCQEIQALQCWNWNEYGPNLGYDDTWTTEWENVDQLLACNCDGDTNMIIDDCGVCRLGPECAEGFIECENTNDPIGCCDPDFNSTCDGCANPFAENYNPGVDILLEDPYDCVFDWNRFPITFSLYWYYEDGDCGQEEPCSEENPARSSIKLYDNGRFGTAFDECEGSYHITNWNGPGQIYFYLESGTKMHAYYEHLTRRIEGERVAQNGDKVGKFWIRTRAFRPRFRGGPGSRAVDVISNSKFGATETIVSECNEFNTVEGLLLECDDVPAGTECVDFYGPEQCLYESHITMNPNTSGCSLVVDENDIPVACEGQWERGVFGSTHLYFQMGNTFESLFGTAKGLYEIIRPGESTLITDNDTGESGLQYYPDGSFKVTYTAASDESCFGAHPGSVAESNENYTGLNDPRGCRTVMIGKFQGPESDLNPVIIEPNLSLTDPGNWWNNNAAYLIDVNYRKWSGITSGASYGGYGLFFNPGYCLNYEGTEILCNDIMFSDTECNETNCNGIWVPRPPLNEQMPEYPSNCPGPDIPEINPDCLVTCHCNLCGDSLTDCEDICPDFDFIPGDVDNDGFVDIQDILIMVNYILGIYNPNQFWPFELSHEDFVIIGDLTGDGVVNTTDIIEVINYILYETSSQLGIVNLGTNTIAKDKTKPLTKVTNYLVKTFKKMIRNCSEQRPVKQHNYNISHRNKLLPWVTEDNNSRCDVERILRKWVNLVNQEVEKLKIKSINELIEPETIIHKKSSIRKINNQNIEYGFSLTNGRKYTGKVINKQGNLYTDGKKQQRVIRRRYYKK